jgi:hypothetical protein
VRRDLIPGQGWFSLVGAVDHGSYVAAALASAGGCHVQPGVREHVSIACAAACRAQTPCSRYSDTEFTHRAFRDGVVIGSASLLGVIYFD